MGVSFEEPEVISEGRKDVRGVPCKLCEQQLADGGGTTNLYRPLASLVNNKVQLQNSVLQSKRSTTNGLLAFIHSGDNYVI